MWFEHDGELFNLERLVAICRVGSFDIALYDRIAEIGYDDEDADYLILNFDSVNERNKTFEFIKKNLDVICGQTNKKDRKAREEGFQELEEP